ncbi:MAG: N-6 DNA methylase [Shewanella algae]
MTPVQENQAQQCLSECWSHINDGAHEATIRSVFNSHLRIIAGTPLPWWAKEHFEKTEAALKSTRGNRFVTGFADNLVGLTAIEYEKDLSNQKIFDEGFSQVKEYVAGLLNKNAPADNIRGILSDTVRWYAYEIDSVSATAVSSKIAGADVTLKPASKIHSIDCSKSDEYAARQLHQFLEVHLGRDSGQILSAKTLKDIIGLESAFGEKFLLKSESIVDKAFTHDPGYALMVQKLWSNFVSFVATSDAHVGAFDKQAYVFELYLLTVAKLIAANVLKGEAIVSPKSELIEIINGGFFKAQGISNLVEYDYFGWLTNKPHIDGLVELSGEIQKVLKAFNFSFLQAEDLFGQLVMQLAERTQRLLLGQEPTPGWLVTKLVSSLTGRIDPDQPWRLVDPCCGSGAFIVEVVKNKIQDSAFDVLSNEKKNQVLSQVITGFDIDPLAVILAKVSWLVAVRPSISAFNSAFPVSIPIYHADSLFATTPLSQTVTVNRKGFQLILDDQQVDLPEFLVTPEFQGFFDEYVEGLYQLAHKYSGIASTSTIDKSHIYTVLDSAIVNTATTLSISQRSESELFGYVFCSVLYDLENRGRNGLWLYMLKNGYRPALVRGQFNGVVTNFPWLALSKLSDNPYTSVLQRMTSEFNLRPQSQSAIHLELATIFLVHAAKHYLQDGGHVAAVVPNSVIQGDQHAPLRSGEFRKGANSVQLNFVEVWDVGKETFGKTNLAAALIGKKGHLESGALTGRFVSESHVDVTYPLHLSTLKKRNAWTKTKVVLTGGGSFDFEQGADIMPRTPWFHEVSDLVGPGGIKKLDIQPISRANSKFKYLISSPKKCKDFRAVATTVSSDWGFEVLTSAHLLQFLVNDPATAILPLKRRDTLGRVIKQAEVSAFAADRAADNHFSRVFAALKAADGWNVDSIDLDYVFDERLNVRNKITKQEFSSGDLLVVYSASGDYPAAAKFTVTPGTADKLIIDQTLYWMVVNDNEQADYIVGLMNSSRLSEVIRPFQPAGLQGRRHLHLIPPSVIPEWDPSNQLHVDVIATTRALFSELELAIQNCPDIRHVVETPSVVSRRRTALRKLLATLPSYDAYEKACALVV